MQRSNRGVRMGQVHKLIDQQGRQLAGGQIPGRRADRIALAASSTMSDEHMGEISTVIYSGWCHAGLPHRKTADEQDWRIVTEHLTLVVEPGKLPNKDGTSTYVGVPYGPVARLILYFLMDRALETGSRTVAVRESFGVIESISLVLLSWRYAASGVEIIVAWPNLCQPHLPPPASGHPRL
jgi:hypothetical protein